MKIGNITIPKTAGLAPMAGVGDRAFREICKEFDCAYVVSEMASSKGLSFQGSKTEELLTLSEKERPAAIQIFGDDPQIMAQAAQLTLKFKPDIIDINMGCPAPKVAGNGGGSALMKNPKLAGEIVKAVSSAVELPVTVKFRKGWDENSVNAVEFAKIMEENGAAALCIHGRTRQQMYAPSADWEIIRKGKEILRRAEISHKIIAGAARNTCYLCVFIGIRPRKYLVQSTVPAAGVKAHRFPVITVLPGDFSRVAGVLCQLHSIIHTRTGRRVDQPRHKIKAGVRFPGYRIHNKNMLHQGIPLSSHFIIIIPHLYQTYNCHSVQKSGR